MSIKRLGSSALAIAALAAAGALASCAGLPSHDHDHDHEHGGDRGRLLVSTLDGRLIVAEAKDGSVISAFPGAVGGPASVYASWTGEYGFAVDQAAGAATIVDSGQKLVEHGGHDDLQLGAASILWSGRIGDKPVHFNSGSGRSAIYNDGSGDMALWHDKDLRAGKAFTRIPARVDHGAPVVLADRTVTGYLNHGQVEVLADDGKAVQTLPGGTKLHGEARLGRFVAFGLAEGVLVLTQEGERYSGKVIPKPAGSPEGARVSTLYSNPALPFLVGNFGQALAKIDPVSGAFEVKPLPASPWRFGIDRSGAYIVALGQDGVLYVFDSSFKLLSSSPVTAKRNPDAPATAPTPRLALGSGIAYILEPGSNEILEVHLDAGDVEARFKFPGAGVLWDVSLMKTDGVIH